MQPLLKKIETLADQFDEVESAVQAFVPEADRFDRLRREAESLLSRFPDPENRPALFGKLVGVKDIFHADGFETRAGSHLPPKDLAGKEAASVRAFRENGALIIGKTVTTEFAYFGPGPTHNPHNLAHTPGGSSSGSAAAVAAGLCELALGTQTIGSVNRPAAFCGVIGYKPSYDRISRVGVIPLSGSMDHVGLFAEKVADARAAASRLVSSWQPSALTSPMRLGVPAGPYLDRASAEAQAHLADVIAALKDAGFEVAEVPLLEDFQQVYERHQLVVAAEAARVHTAWFEAHADRYHAKTRELILKGKQITDQELSEVLAQVRAYRLQVAAAMTGARIDAFVTPSATGPAPVGLDSTGDPVMNLPWTQAGLPTLTIPTGAAASGLPLGTQLVGKWHLDEKLFEIARLVEPTISHKITPHNHIRSS